MIFYCKFKHYVLSVECKDIRDWVHSFDKYFSSRRELPLLKSIEDITTRQHLDKLDCSDLPYYENRFNQTVLTLQHIEGIGYCNLQKQNTRMEKILIQFEVEKPIFVLLNVDEIHDSILKTQRELFPVFKTYEQAYFHNFLEAEQYKLFPNGFCGIVKQFYDHDELHREMFMNNDKIEGIETVYDSNGQVIERTNWVNGKKNGLSEHFKRVRDGYNIEYSTEYKDDKKHGEEINYYNTEKNNIRKVRVFDNGVIVSLKKYNSGGELKEERTYDANGMKRKTEYL